MGLREERRPHKRPCESDESISTYPAGKRTTLTRDPRPSASRCRDAPEFAVGEGQVAIGSLGPIEPPGQGFRLRIAFSLPAA